MNDRQFQFSEYQNRIKPWCIVRHLPDVRSVVVDRFRRRGDAEAYLRTLNRLLPNVAHSLVFDLGNIAEKAERVE